MVRNNGHMSEKVNLSPLAIMVLAHLSRSPDQQFYVRELAGLIGGSVGGCHKVLRNLYEMGLVDKNKSGRNLYYKIKYGNPAIKYFKIFINIQEVNQNITTIVEKCQKIILYGSCSIGEDTMDSDIDLLLITENPKEIRQRLRNKYIGHRKLKSLILLPHELIKLKEKDRAFYVEVNKGIVLRRGSDERV